MGLSKANFTKGMAVFFSCGGPNIDKATLGIWHKMVEHINPLDFELAIMQLCQGNTELGKINFPGEICTLAKANKVARERKAAYEHKKLEEAPDPKSLAMGKAVSKHVRENGFEGLPDVIKDLTKPVKLERVV